MESKAIYTKMAQVMKDIGAIGKGQKNAAQGYSFRGIEDVMNALNPALIKHEVFLAPEVTSYTQELKDVTRSNGKQAVDKHVSLLVKYTFWTTDGSSVTFGPVAGEGLDSGDKATNKALSAALKYALTQGFMITTADMTDADSDSPEIAKNSTSSSSLSHASNVQFPEQPPKASTGSFRKPKPKTQPTETTSQTGTTDDWQ